MHSWFCALSVLDPFCSSEKSPSETLHFKRWILELNLRVCSLFSKENLFSVVQVLCIKSSTTLSLGHTRKLNLEILQKAKLPIFCLRSRHWYDYFWLWFQVIYLIFLQCYHQHVFSHEEHINLVVALGKSKQKHQKKLTTRMLFHKKECHIDNKWQACV